MTTESTAFATLPLSTAMLANLDALGYASMTPIQAQSLPVILKGQDLIAQAKTGSGKTAAFGIGLLNPINPRYFGCQALVLCPTRELADQVAKELRRLARAEDNIKILTLCGGVSLGPQIASLEHGAHIIVGTPGRIQQHLDKGTLVLDGLNTLVLDEADRMLDMGFFDAIASIIGKTPSRRQTLLFSATYPAGIKQLAPTSCATRNRSRSRACMPTIRSSSASSRSTRNSASRRSPACSATTARSPAWRSASPSSSARMWSPT